MGRLFLHFWRHLPLWSAAASLIHETIGRSGANPEMGPALYRIFQEAGLPAPTMRWRCRLGNDPDLARWYLRYYVHFATANSAVESAVESLGSLDTLLERLQAEVAASNSVAVGWPSSGRGPAKLSPIGCELFSGVASRTSPTPAWRFRQRQGPNAGCPSCL